MRRGDQCKLRDAPKNAILRAVAQFRYNVPWYFVVREDGFQPRAHLLDVWVVEKNGMQNRELPDTLVEIIDFLDDELEEREWQSS